MMAQIDDQLDGLAAMSPARLRAEWRRLHRGQVFPDGLTSSQLTRAIAWRLQEKALGGIAPARFRELNRLAEQLAMDGEIDVGGSGSIKPGSRLVRHWHGAVHSVTVLDDGFEFEEQHFSSLTQIARQITGAAWSGPRFFGLKGRAGGAL
jgi:putative heme degradation protein